MSYIFLQKINSIELLSIYRCEREKMYRLAQAAVGHACEICGLLLGEKGDDSIQGSYNLSTHDPRIFNRPHDIQVTYTCNPEERIAHIAVVLFVDQKKMIALHAVFEYSPEGRPCVVSWLIDR
jgi:hypothetical protein